MAEETLSERLASRHAALQLNQVPDAVAQAAKLHILDSLGCLLAGSRLEPGKLAYDLAAASSDSGSTSTLLGTDSRVSFLDAVQAMSVAAHCGEMDDVHSGAGTCIGGMIVPALVAMAEKYGGNGRDFLEGAIVGYETTARVGLAINELDDGIAHQIAPVARLRHAAQRPSAIRELFLREQLDGRSTLGWRASSVLPVPV